MENVILNSNAESNKVSTKVSFSGKVLIGVTGGIAVGLTIICAPFVSPALRKICLPYIPATNEQLRNIITALKGRKGSLIDLGSGDGRIVLETAKQNFTSHGVELNPWLVLYSKLDALRKGAKNTKFFCKDLWKFNISPYENVVIFGVEQMMPTLEKKILEECGKNTDVIACRFPLPNLQPYKVIGVGIDTVWVYKIS